MPRCLYLCCCVAVLIAAPNTTTAQSPDAAPKQAPAAHKAPKATAATPVAPDHNAQLNQYRRDLINLLALRASAPPLIAAALLATPDADDKDRPPSLKAPALLKRARAAAPDDALVWWVSANLECVRDGNSCAHADMLQKLESIDSDNAAVWLFSLARAQQAQNAQLARAALTSAAQAKRFDSYFAAATQTVFNGMGTLPAPEDVLVDGTQDALRITWAMGFSAVLAAQILAPLSTLCADPDAADTALVSDCLALAQKMEFGSNFIEQGTGLIMRGKLLPEGPDRAAVQARFLALRWQQVQFFALTDTWVRDPSLSKLYAGTWIERGSEVAATYAVLRARGIALDPPPDWRPPEAADSVQRAQEP